MTPGLADTLALVFYLVFWGAIFAMLDYTLSHVWGLTPFSWTFVIIVAGLFSYVTVFLSKINS